MISFAIAENGILANVSNPETGEGVTVLLPTDWTIIAIERYLQQLVEFYE